jgi:hypothetical protein
MSGALVRGIAGLRSSTYTRTFDLIFRIRLAG